MKRHLVAFLGIAILCAGVAAFVWYVDQSLAHMTPIGGTR